MNAANEKTPPEQTEIKAPPNMKTPRKKPILLLVCCIGIILVISGAFLSWKLITQRQFDTAIPRHAPFSFPLPTAKANFSPPPATPTDTSGQTPYNILIAGIKDGQLAVYNPDTDQVFKKKVYILNDTTVPLLSPDKQKVLITHLQAFTEPPAGQISVIAIYDFSSDALSQFQPVRDTLYPKMGATGGSAFSNPFYAWDENSQGILYVTSGTASEHQGIGELARLRFRYKNLLDNTDSIVFEIQKDYGEEDDALLGYNKAENKIIMGDTIGPIIDDRIHILDPLTKSDTPVAEITGKDFSVPLARRLSPDRRRVIGELASFRQGGNVRTGAFAITPLAQPADKTDVLSILRQTSQPISSLENSQLFFIDNTTAAVIVYNTYQANTTKEPLISIFIIDTATKTVRASANITQPLYANEEGTVREDIQDISANGTILTTQNIIRNDLRKGLPQGFSPIGFIQ